jgi:hypothetical protein
MPGPIKPSEVDKRRVIPEAVFEAFNLLIVQKWDGHQAVIRQDEVIPHIMKMFGISRDEVFSRNYLDVELAYRKEGWSVTYDKPGFNETGQATFIFRKKNKK